MAAEKKVETATVKKPVAPKATVKVDALKTDVKAEAKKVVAVKEEAKKVEKKAAAPKKAATPKKAAAPKKEAAPKAAPVAKKTATKCATTVQFGEKSYTTEDFEKIANDVWVYDYDKKASELKKVELYVKPFENKVYYVFNDEITGSFDI